MKKTYLSLAFLFLLAGPALAQTRSINFETGSFAEVLEKAKKENKPIFLDAYTTWCGPCKWMDNYVFKDDKVADYFNENFIAFKSDMEKGEGIELAKRYEVKAYPNLLFINPDGTVLHRSVGSRPAEAFIMIGKDALNPDKQFQSFQKKYDAGNRDPQFVLQYIKKKEEAALDVSNEINAYFNTINDKELSNHNNWALIRNYVRSSESQLFKRFIENRSKFNKAFSKDTVDFLILGVYNSDLNGALYRKNMEMYTNLKTELEKLKVSNANKVIWGTEAQVYLQKGEIASYGNTVTKLVEKYFQENADALNNYAWEIYEKVDDQPLLQKAEHWALKSTQINPSYYNLDTYAAVLYKLGKKNEAKAAAEKAIASGRQIGEDTSETEILLQKIKQLK